jgi:hypothetical protein
MWIELHDSAREHPKVLRLARRLRISNSQALGHVISLWCWTLRMAPDGDLSSFCGEDLEVAAQWEGEPGAFVNAALEMRLVDRGEFGLVVHDWEDYSGSLKAAKRTREHRARKAEHGPGACVYLLHSKRRGMFKIGHTANLVRRIEEHEREYGESLDVLGHRRGTVEDERKVHAQFAHLREGRTEWFRIDDSLVAFCAGYFGSRYPANPPTAGNAGNADRPTDQTDQKDRPDRQTRPTDRDAAPEAALVVAPLPKAAPEAAALSVPVVVGAGDLDSREVTWPELETWLVHTYGQTVRPKWVRTARDLAPYTRREILHAHELAASAAASDGRGAANPGLFFTKLQRVRSEPPAERLNGKPQRLSPKAETLRRSVENLHAGMFDRTFEGVDGA